MAQAEEYRQKAEEAEAQAQAAKDQAAREVYRDIARRWREMAEQVDRYRW